MSFHPWKYSHNTPPNMGCTRNNIEKASTTVSLHILQGGNKKYTPRAQRKEGTPRIGRGLDVSSTKNKLQRAEGARRGSAVGPKRGPVSGGQFHLLLGMRECRAEIQWPPQTSRWAARFSLAIGLLVKRQPDRSNRPPELEYRGRPATHHDPERITRLDPT